MRGAVVVVVDDDGAGVVEVRAEVRDFGDEQAAANSMSATTDRGAAGAPRLTIISLACGQPLGRNAQTRQTAHPGGH
jgi:hypothetical protein